MKCSNPECGRSGESDNGRCEHCGSDMVKEPRTVICSGIKKETGKPCGRKLTEDKIGKFCGECDLRVTADLSEVVHNKSACPCGAVSQNDDECCSECGQEGNAGWRYLILLVILPCVAAVLFNFNWLACLIAFAAMCGFVVCQYYRIPGWRYLILLVILPCVAAVLFNFNWLACLIAFAAMCGFVVCQYYRIPGWRYLILLVILPCVAAVLFNFNWLACLIAFAAMCGFVVCQYYRIPVEAAGQHEDNQSETEGVKSTLSQEEAEGQHEDNNTSETETANSTLSQEEAEGQHEDNNTSETETANSTLSQEEAEGQREDKNTSETETANSTLSQEEAEGQHEDNNTSETETANSTLSQEEAEGQHEDNNTSETETANSTLSHEEAEGQREDKNTSETETANSTLSQGTDAEIWKTPSKEEKINYAESTPEKAKGQHDDNQSKMEGTESTLGQGAGASIWKTPSEGGESHDAEPIHEKAEGQHDANQSKMEGTESTIRQGAGASIWKTPSEGGESHDEEPIPEKAEGQHDANQSKMEGTESTLRQGAGASIWKTPSEGGESNDAEPIPEKAEGQHDANQSKMEGTESTLRQGAGASIWKTPSEGGESNDAEPIPEKAEGQHDANQSKMEGTESTLGQGVGASIWKTPSEGGESHDAEPIPEKAEGQHDANQSKMEGTESILRQGTSRSQSNASQKKRRENPGRDRRDPSAERPRCYTARGPNEVTVTFKVLVPLELLKGAHAVNVQFCDQRYGGFESGYHKMKHIRDFDGLGQYEYLVHIHQGNLRIGIQYRYCVTRPNQYEILTISSIMRLQKHTIQNQGEWTVYDAIGGKRKYYFWSKPFFSNREEPLDPAVCVSNVFLPLIFEDQLRSRDLGDIRRSCENFECLVHGLKQTYLQNDQQWKYLTEEVFARLFHELVEKIYVIEDETSRIMQAVSVAVVTQRHGIRLSGVSLAQLSQCLLPHVNDKYRTCPVLDEIYKHFNKSDVINGLNFIIGRVCNLGKNPSWMFCLPLLHFTSGFCKPFEPVTKDLSHAQQIPVWWGTAEIPKYVEKFQKHHGPWQISVDVVIGQLRGHFKADKYLARSIVASGTLAELPSLVSNEFIPVEVCAASLLYWIKTAWKSRWKFWNSDEIIRDTITRLFSRLESVKHVQDQSLASWLMSCYISADIITEIMDKGSGVDDIVRCVQVFLKCMQHHNFRHICQPPPPHCRVETYNWDNIYSRVLSWLHNRTCSHNNVRIFLKTWDRLFLEAEANDSIANAWNDKLSKEMSSALNKKVDEARFSYKHIIGVYCNDYDQYTKPVYRVITNLANKAVEKRYDYNYTTLKHSAKKKFGDLWSMFFKKHWDDCVQLENDGSDQKILVFMLTWPPATVFIKHYELDSTDKLLSEDCKDKLFRGISVINRERNSLQSGHVTVESLKLIDKHADTFADLVQLSGTLRNRHHLIAGIQMRSKELSSLDKKAKQIEFFEQKCVRLSRVNTEAIGRVRAILQDLDNKTFKDFCEPVPFDRLHNAEPVIALFDELKEVLDIVPRLQKLDKSTVFIKHWEALCDEHSKDCVSIDDVLTLIWRPAEARMEHLMEQLSEGTISYKTLQDVFGHAIWRDRSRLKEEMTILGLSDATVVERMKQIEQFQKITKCVKGAITLLNIKEVYSLEGDFRYIEAITEHDKMDFLLNEFDEDLIQTCKGLMNITDDDVECILAFTKSKDLVEWLRESMKNAGQKEVKVFVDLAMMNAGEEPLNIGKVQCLHSAVIGYSPLIFDLESSCSYSKLLGFCRLVWNELKSNPNLPTQLVDTNKELPWLKEIKEAHGSVEVSSLLQAEAINTGGIFYVGRMKGGDIDSDGLHSRVPEDIVVLTVPEDGEKGRHTTLTFSFKQLQDLQSRLMMIDTRSGKTTNSANESFEPNFDVERFTSMFDSVTRLSTVYIKLTLAGCVLFRDWSAEFLCSRDEKRPVCAILEFGRGDDVPEIKGRKNLEEQVEDIIPKIAGFMEECLHDWLQHIKEKRKSYFHLNYFTVDQLVILQRELVKVGTEEQPSNLVYPLLEAVKTACNPDDLKKAVLQAMEHMSEKSEQKKKIEEEFKQEKNKRSADVDKLNVTKRQYLEKLMEEADISEEVALKILAKAKKEDIETCDVTDGMLLSIELSGDEDSRVIDDHDRESEAFTGLQTENSSIYALIKTSVRNIANSSQCGAAPLIASLEQLWKNFLESISSSVSDYLSLEHLGIILTKLAKSETTHLVRTLPATLLKGEPNLLICPPDNMLTNTLAIYMVNEAQPLPRSDEILTCTANTTIDEIGIFLRRAVFDTEEKIHCLLHAELLAFEVCESAELCLEEYLRDKHQSSDKRFNLVVLCSSESELKSNIASYLHKYNRVVSPVSGLKVSEYVKRKLSVCVTETKAAATVDTERLSVRIVKSRRSGEGKSLYISRRIQSLQEQYGSLENVTVKDVRIPLQDKHIDVNYVANRLLEHSTDPGTVSTRIFHIDIFHEVQEGIDYLLFNLIILNCLSNNLGYVWRRSIKDMYLIECMPIMRKRKPADSTDTEMVVEHPVFDILSSTLCRSPNESLSFCEKGAIGGYQATDHFFDDKELQSDTFMRPFKYLKRLDQKSSFQNVIHQKDDVTNKECLSVFLRHCGISDPSWSELHHFAKFLNAQLLDYERNVFVSALQGFGEFVIKFMVQMSRDFSTRSLNDDGKGEDLSQYEMKRTWESSPHPYLFFNQDGQTFTFIGFNIEMPSRNLKDVQTGQILERSIMTRGLHNQLKENGAPLKEDFDILSREEKLQRLRSVIGNDRCADDPDATYELTTDNVKKLLAIHMRFRCDIPVIVMGETGCGKTRLVKFLCALQAPKGVKVDNMILMKIHGGTTKDDIKRNVEIAEEVSVKNRAFYGSNMYTVLFFDEANTTDALGLIKEIMCDRSIQGTRMLMDSNLKIVAACNPYRMHSEELVKKLETAGLGYHVDADNTTDRLGKVPMRRLVYRVQPMPRSMLPLVWDFGQLDTTTENLYIKQMVKRYEREEKIPTIQGLAQVVASILTTSQGYMRTQKDECSFVSLRDVDRALTVMSWFYQCNKKKRILFDAMDDKLKTNDAKSMIKDVTRSLILAIGVCYHACLTTRDEYRELVCKMFVSPCEVQTADSIFSQIQSCQEVFLDNVQLDKNIARNMALKENVFMMIVCIELRLPLFFVGKPGSSKSLAKTIVSDAMQGNTSRKALMKMLKKVQLVSFQCSPLATPDGIVGCFRQCAQLQKDKNLDTFTSVVVLDEVGLAEDSPRMPLKTLHPLLEDGCQGDESPQPYMKVAFIGISNWALDPAKMNRGILVQREVPDIAELEKSARGICTTNEDVDKFISPLIKPLSMAYTDMFKKATDKMREFFGLRDFYSLIKMVYAFVAKSKRKPTKKEIEHAIRRNFGGLAQVDPFEVFNRHILDGALTTEEDDYGPDCTQYGLVEACLFNTNRFGSESRYLLLLTEQYGALSIIQQQFIQEMNISPMTIFGSSFKRDQEYTQICRNINKIKLCMETGKTVILLNLENLYESLYDALNQYYMYFGGARYVDLGLGSHRVKCPVHESFRLIVVAEKDNVYKTFPIPLINRLEKHFLSSDTMLNDKDKKYVRELHEWAKNVSSTRSDATSETDQSSGARVNDVFIGYHKDTCASVVLHVCSESKAQCSSTPNKKKEILEKAKSIMLWCATPEAIIRIGNTPLQSDEQLWISRVYNEEQSHYSFLDYLSLKVKGGKNDVLFAQVITHSKLLTKSHKQLISDATGIATEDILLLDSLPAIETEQQFTERIRKHLDKKRQGPSMLVVQCDSGDINANLIECARYCIMDEHQKCCAQKPSDVDKDMKMPAHVVLIIQLPRKKGGSYSGFQCGKWQTAYVDNLLSEDIYIPPPHCMTNKTIGELFNEIATSLDGYRDSAEESRPLPTSLPSNDGVEMSAVDHRSSTTSSTLLNVDGIVQLALHKALSYVKNRSSDSEREIDRLGLVLEGTRDTEKARDFLDSLIMLIASFLKEGHANPDWLLLEAAPLDKINEAGTFRRACLNALVENVCPVIAWILGHLDICDNLDFLTKHSSWKRAFWIKGISRRDVIQIQSSLIETSSNNQSKYEVQVPVKGAEEHSFKGTIPFSWIIFETISNILSDERNVDHDKTTVGSIDTLELVFIQTPIGRLLNECVTERNSELEAEDDFCKDFLADYILDATNMIYKTQGTNQQQCMCNAVMVMTQDFCEKNNLSSAIIPSMFCVHKALNLLSLQLEYVRDVHTVWPNCCTVICEREKTNNLYDENVLAYKVLATMIKDAEPNGQMESSEHINCWLNKIHTYRSSIENGLRVLEDPELRSSLQDLSLQKLSEDWQRLMAMKLFTEDVCMTGDKHTQIPFIMLYWKLLKDKSNFKQRDALETTIKFLKSCNKHAIKQIFRQVEKCCKCDRELEGAPISLPCLHVLCDECLAGIKAQKRLTCPTCKKNFVSESIKRVDEKSTEVQRLTAYQRRCNIFFANVVSQLCFAGDTAPADEVMNLLLTYVTSTKTAVKYTKALTIFNTGIDPNPVFRSFLLQLIMRSSHVLARAQLQKYFNSTNEVMARENNTELATLVIYCQEDVLLRSIYSDKKSMFQVASSSLHAAGSSIIDTGLQVEMMYSIAGARVGLCIAGNFIVNCLRQKKNMDDITEEEELLLHEAMSLCHKSHRAKMFIVKHICKSYGTDMYYTLCRHAPTKLNWIDLGIGKNTEVCDRYIVCGDAYVTIRKAVSEVIIGNEIDTLQRELKAPTPEADTRPTIQHPSRPHTPPRADANKNTNARARRLLRRAAGLQHQEDLLVFQSIMSSSRRRSNYRSFQNALDSSEQLEVLLTLAIHREVTCADFRPATQVQHMDPGVEKVVDFIETSEVIKEKNMPVAFAKKQMLSVHLKPTAGESLRNQSLQCLVVHYMTVMKHVTGERLLLRLFIDLIETPGRFKDVYLPTMPIDELEEIADQFADLKGAGGNMYKCPNGHPYIIGDCGQAWTVGKCNICGAAIGGQVHRLRANNTVYCEFNTPKGYALGSIETRETPASTNERPADKCSATRLLLHMSMYLATLNDEGADSVHELISPLVDKAALGQFFWDHMQRDIDDLSQTIPLSADDVFVLMHILVWNIFNTTESGAVDNDVASLKTNRLRKQWETHFTIEYLTPVFKTMNVRLQEVNRAIVNDNRIDELHCIVHEIGTAQTRDATDDDVVQLHECPRAWRYRTPISIEHMKKEFTASRNTRSGVLQLFLKMDPVLKLLKYVPSVMSLQKALILRYRCRVDKNEAKQIFLRDVKLESMAGAGTDRMVSDFQRLWEALRPYLKQYMCRTDFGGVFAADKYTSAPMTDDTPLSVLLPSDNDDGFCSYIMLDFLFRKQNEFIDSFLNKSKRKLESVPTVIPSAVTSAHLISYDHDNDLLPMVMFNCQYTFEMGKGTQIEYDFEGLERQIIDRFVFAKSKIIFKPTLKIEMMVYRTDVTTSSVLEELDTRIEPVVISSGLKSQITEELQYYPDVCSSLDNLNIAIGFLKTTATKDLSKENLNEYMTDVLLMEMPLKSQKACQTCEFKHTKSLWLLLALQKSKLSVDLYDETQDPFETLRETVKEPLTDELKRKMKKFLQLLSPEKMTRLVEALHEFLVIFVSRRENTDDEGYIDTTDKSVCEYLHVYLNDVAIPTPDIDACNEIIQDFPRSILFKHCVSAWVLAYKTLKTKCSGQNVA